VKKVQAGYKAQPLSQFLGMPAPPAAAAIDFIKALTSNQERTLPEFFNILNFVLEFCPTNPSEKELMGRFAKLNIGAGKDFRRGQSFTRSEEGRRGRHGRCGRPSRRQES
jgi:hypothetical protein